MKKISKKVREDAALICAILASTRGIWSDDVAIELEMSRESDALAEQAFDYVIREAWRTADAEAESLLRSGWSPS